MDSRKEWHKLKDSPKKDRQKEVTPPPSKKPSSHTNSPGGSRQGNAGTEENNEGARR